MRAVGYHPVAALTPGRVLLCCVLASGGNVVKRGTVAVGPGSRMASLQPAEVTDEGRCRYIIPHRSRPELDSYCPALLV